MRILQVHNLYVHPGGEDTIADTEVELLRGAGHEVERLRVRNQESGLPAARSFAAAPWNPRQHRAMRARVRRLRPDIAHVHNTWFALSPSIFHALAAERVPTVMTIQNFRLVCAEGKLYRDGRLCTACVGTHPWRAVRYACYRDSRPASLVAAGTIAINRWIGSWDCIDRFLAPSQFVRSILVRAGFDSDRIRVKPNVIGDPGLRQLPPSRSRTLLYVGRLSAEKGPELLLNAWRDACPSVPEMELVIIGDGPLRTALERDAPPRTRFLGWLDPAEVSKQMLGARALIFPTQCSENFGRSIIEAMAAGLPVLASDIATPAELVGELGPRWVVAPHDQGEWREALCGLLDDEAVDAGGRRGRELFEQKYNLAVGLRTLLGVYEEVRSRHAHVGGTG